MTPQLIRTAIGTVLRMVMPWPPKHQRRQAVEKARADKQRAQLDAARAALIETEIRRMAARNGFASAIAHDLALRHRPKG